VIKKEPWAREYYDQKRAAQKGHHAAIRSLAFKLMPSRAGARYV